MEKIEELWFGPKVSAEIPIEAAQRLVATLNGIFHDEDIPVNVEFCYDGTSWWLRVSDFRIEKEVK